MSMVAHGIIAAIPMPAALKGVAHELAEYHNKDTGLCCPSLERLAKNLCCTVRRVQQHLVSLEELGIIRREARFVEGRQTTSNYIFVPILSLRPEAGFTPEGEAGFTPEGEAGFTQNQKKEPKEVTVQHVRGKEVVRRGFEDWWKIYPKKVGKVVAQRAWSRLTVKDAQAAWDDCMDRSWPENKQYIPNPATYLNGKRWQDEADRDDGVPEFMKGVIL